MTSRTIAVFGAGAAGAATAVLGVWHFGLDGLAGVLVPLQPALAARTGTALELWALVVAVAFSTASLLQPAAAWLAVRWGDTRTAVAGVILAIIGYGLVPAAPTLDSVIAAVIVGGVGSALFYPAAGALVARTAPRGKESLPLAVFSALGTAGAAIIPLSVVFTLGPLGALAAVPIVVMMLIAMVGVITLRRGLPHRTRKVPSSTQPAATRNPFVAVSVVAGAMIVLAGTTVNATTPLLIAADRGTTDPLLGVAAAGYSAAGAIGGILLALAARRIGVRQVLLWAVSVGVTAGLAIPHVPSGVAAMLVIPAGAGLSGSLPLLVVMARRPEENTAGGAVARVLGLSAGIGGASYAIAAPLQRVIGADAALTVVVAVAGLAAVALSWRLCRSVDPTDCHDVMPVAMATCACRSVACSDDARTPHTYAAADTAGGAGIRDSTDHLLLTLDDGDALPADLFIVAHGITPTAPPPWDGAMLVDTSHRTSTPHVCAAGGVAVHDDPTLGVWRIDHWADAAAQGEHAARTLLADLGKQDQPGSYQPRAPFTATVHGATIAGAGLTGNHTTVRTESSDPLVVLHQHNMAPVGVLGLNAAPAVFGWIPRTPVALDAEALATTGTGTAHSNNKLATGK